MSTCCFTVGGGDGGSGLNFFRHKYNSRGTRPLTHCHQKSSINWPPFPSPQWIIIDFLEIITNGSVFVSRAENLGEFPLASWPLHAQNNNAAHRLNRSEFSKLPNTLFNKKNISFGYCIFIDSKTVWWHSLFCFFVQSLMDKPWRARPTNLSSLKQQRTTT